MDIEGAEFDIIKNFSKDNYEKINQLTIEFHDFLDHELRKKVNKTIKKLIKLGYACRFDKPTNVLFYKTPYPKLMFIYIYTKYFILRKLKNFIRLIFRKIKSDI